MPNSNERFLATFAIISGLFFVPCHSAFGRQSTGDVAGSVVDEDGKAIEGVSVYSIRKTWPSGRYRQQAFNTKTNESGKFNFKNHFKEGDRVALNLSVLAIGFGLTSRYIANEEGAALDAVKFKLQKADKISFHFCDSDGEPLSGLMIYPGGRVDDEGDKHHIYFQNIEDKELETDADGNIVLQYFCKGDKATFQFSGETGHEPVTVKIGAEASSVRIELGGSNESKTEKKPAVWMPVAKEPDPAHIAWLKKNAVSIESTDPENDSFEDLEPLKELIGDARIVQLGEQTHGDGTCFETKIRLIKFLHQEMGFDVLAFESGLFDCREAWKQLVDGRPALASVQQGIFGIWTNSRQVQPLFKYLRDQSQKERPLELCGFDCQFTGRASQSLVKSIRKFFDGNNESPLSDKAMDEFCEQLSQLILNQEPKGEVSEFANRCDELGKAALAMSKKRSGKVAREAIFWEQQFKSLAAQAANRWKKSDNPMAGANKRDAQMADNLVWLAKNFYPNRKIVVWAASFHIMRNASSITVPSKSIDYHNTVPMGHLVHQELSDELCTIGFVTYEGSAGNCFYPSYKLTKSPAGTLEDIFVRAGFDNALVMLNSKTEGSDWLRQPIYARPLGNQYMLADWSNVFDALIFNRKMTPSTRN